jgi:hypothetical protein
MRNLADAFETAVDVLEGLDVPYAVMGGMAVRVFGIPRATYDLDFTADLDAQQLAALLDGLEERGFLIPTIYRRGNVDRIAGMPILKARMHLPEGGFDVDFFLVESDFQKVLISRRRRVTTEARQLWVVSPEDLVLLKLAAGRPRDLGDVETILFIMGQLDDTYLWEWAEKLDVADRLETALCHSGPV